MVNTFSRWLFRGQSVLLILSALYLWYQPSACSALHPPDPCFTAYAFAGPSLVLPGPVDLAAGMILALAGLAGLILSFRRGNLNPQPLPPRTQPGTDLNPQPLPPRGRS